MCSVHLWINRLFHTRKDTTSSFGRENVIFSIELGNFDSKYWYSVNCERVQNSFHGKSQTEVLYTYSSNESGGEALYKNRAVKILKKVAIHKAP